jgi:hypothetical protein
VYAPHCFASCIVHFNNACTWLVKNAIFPKDKCPCNWTTRILFLPLLGF